LGYVCAKLIAAAPKLKKIGYLSIAALLVLLLQSATRHEYYVSVATAEYNAKDGVLEVGLKVFTDDLERTINQNTAQQLKLSDAKQSTAADDFLAEYLEQRFVLTKAGKLLELIYVGKEVGLDETWLYFQIAMPASGTFWLKHAVLMDAFPSQVNIVHFEVNGKKQSQYFTADKPQIELTLP
jgi:hypothetical protein